MIVPNHHRRLGAYTVTHRRSGQTVSRTFRTPDHAAAFARTLGRRARARVELARPSRLINSAAIAADPGRMALSRSRFPPHGGLRVRFPPGPLLPARPGGR
jgi:hypothetical protein